nr:MAG TPA: hyaluronidase [Caudoviricetes sp.]
MALYEINGRMKQKRDTAANWEAKNPVILNGEIVLVDTNAGELRAKIGDGVKKYL